MATTEIPALRRALASANRLSLSLDPPFQPPPWMMNATGAGLFDFAFQKSRTLRVRAYHSGLLIESVLGLQKRKLNPFFEKTGRLSNLVAGKG